MSVRRLAIDQPESFAFTPENLEWARTQIKKYPEGRQASAVLPILWRAQEQVGGWLTEPALRYVADMLGLAYIRIYEIATFYTMFNLAPVGRHYVQVCGTTPCWLRGADAIKDTCRRLIGAPDHVTKDGLFSWTEVECLAACVNAPVVQIDKDYYEDLTPESLEKILKDLKAGRAVTPGPQNGRQASAPIGGPTTLTDPELYRNEAPDKPVPPKPKRTSRKSQRPEPR
jgi:NADH-quinone oxidoreductase subunit E